MTNPQLDWRLQDAIIFAARYAHQRKTAAAGHACMIIQAYWDQLSEPTRQQLISESHEACCNFEDWRQLRKWAEKQ